MNRKFRRRYLRERQWKLTVPNTMARKFRDAIGEWDDEDDYEIQANDLTDCLEALKDILYWINSNLPEDYDESELEDDINDIDNQIDNLENYEDYDMSFEDVVDEIDWLINGDWGFFSLCDSLNIFVPL